MDMNPASQAWVISPLWAPAIALVIIEELGLSRLRARSVPRRVRTWRLRAFAYEGGLVALCLLESSPLVGKSMDHLWIHMLLHVLVMFYLPVVLVLGAPFVPALFALPVRVRRAVLRSWHLGRTRWLTRRVGALVTAPLFAIVVFNATMIGWHLPVAMDFADGHAWARTWLMTGSFVIAGYLFWRIILPSGPFRPRGRLGIQAISVGVTSVVMLVISIAMAVMSRGAWYQMNIEMLGPSAALHDQQLAAGILWICGDFWAAPAMVLIVRRAMASPGGIGGAFERSLGRSA